MSESKEKTVITQEPTSNNILSLSDDRKEEIESISYDIHKKYALSVKFDLIKFLTTYKDFEIQLKPIDDNTTGLLLIDEDNKVPDSDANKVIIINKNLSNDVVFEQKRRFICAHEYGHDVLHRGSSRKYARRDNGAKNTVEELEAEYFAYCFLMPKNFIMQIVNDNDIKKAVKKLMAIQKCDLSTVVAEIFNVTPKKAHKRLTELGVFDVF